MNLTLRRIPGTNPRPIPRRHEHAVGFACSPCLYNPDIAAMHHDAVPVIRIITIPTLTGVILYIVNNNTNQPPPIGLTSSTQRPKIQYKHQAKGTSNGTGSASPNRPTDQVHPHPP